MQQQRTAGSRIVEIERLQGPERSKSNTISFGDDEEIPTPSTSPAIQNAMQEVELTRLQMGQNLNDILDNTERVDHLRKKANELREDSAAFAHSGRRVKRKFWRKHVKLVTGMIVTVVVLLAVTAGVIAIAIVAA